MYPITERRLDGEVGYHIDDFGRHLEAIAGNPELEQAKAFAFIFYDSNDEELRQALADRDDAWTYLDRLSGSMFHIFYLDTNQKADTKEFNRRFMDYLGVGPTAKLPIVALLDVRNGDFCNLRVDEFKKPINKFFAFQMYELIRNLQGCDSGMKESIPSASPLPGSQGYSRIIFQEAFRVGLRELFGRILSHAIGGVD